jgi:hypothetical protein
LRSWVSHLVSQLVSVLEGQTLQHLSLVERRMKHCSCEAAHKQTTAQHIISCACALPASLGASTLSPHIPRIEPQPTETEWASRGPTNKHLLLVNAIHPTQAVNTARHGKPCTLHLHPLTWTATQHMQIRYTARRPPIGAAGVAVVLPFVPCHCSPVSSGTVGRACRCVRIRSGLD